MIVNTMNSAYEIDFVESRVRRLNGKNPSELERVFGTVDGDWQTFVEAKRVQHEAGPVWFFVLNEGYLRTSLVQSEED